MQAVNRIVDRVDAIILHENRPLTPREIATRLGEKRIQQVIGVLEEMTTEGRLAKFYAGPNRYYAVPKIALTDAQPTPRTVLADTLKGMLVVTGLRLAGSSLDKPR